MTKNVKKYEWVILFLFLVSATFYYYGLHLSFWPDPESSGMTLRYYWADKFGNKINKTIDDFNHLMDAMRYAVEKYISKKTISFGYNRII